MDAQRQASPFAGIDWNIRGSQAPATAPGFKPAAHADTGGVALAAKVHEFDFETEDRAAHELRAAAVRETAGALPNNADSSLNERVMSAHREHAKSLALMVSVSLKAIPGARIEGSLSKLEMKERDRSWTASGLSITLADDPNRTWDISLAGNPSSLGGAYIGAQLAKEGANYSLTAEQRGGLELMKDDAWDAGTAPTTIGLQAREWIKNINAKAREYEED